MAGSQYAVEFKQETTRQFVEHGYKNQIISIRSPLLPHQTA